MVNFYTQGFEVYSKVLADIKKKPATTAAATATPLPVPSVVPAAVETVFNLPVSNSGPDSTAAAIDASEKEAVVQKTELSPEELAAISNETEKAAEGKEVEGGWLCL